MRAAAAAVGDELYIIYHHFVYINDIHKAQLIIEKPPRLSEAEAVIIDLDVMRQHPSSSNENAVHCETDYTVIRFRFSSLNGRFSK